MLSNLSLIAVTLKTSAANFELIETDAPLGEKLLYGGKVMLIGMGIVFSVLLVLMGVLYLFTLVSQAVAKRSAKPDESSAVRPETVTPANPPATVSEPVFSPAESSDEDETEIIAVLTAAIAASTGMSTSEFRVINFRRTGRT